MYKKKILFAVITAIVMGTANARNLNCENSTFGCVSGSGYSTTNNYGRYASNNDNSNSSKPRYFRKDGHLYMERDGKMYVYVEQGVLPSDPFGARASFAEVGPASQRGTLIFDPKKLSWAAYNSQGDLVKSGPASGGSGYCPDLGTSCRTPVGHFAVYMKGPSNCKSSKFPIEHPGAPMPYCMFFHGGYAIHGSFDIPDYNASHGCIRIHPVAAQWLSQNFVVPGTRVIVMPYND